MGWTLPLQTGVWPPGHSLSWWKMRTLTEKKVYPKMGEPKGAGTDGHTEAMGRGRGGGKGPLGQEVGMRLELGLLSSAWALAGIMFLWPSGFKREPVAGSPGLVGMLLEVGGGPQGLRF